MSTESAVQPEGKEQTADAATPAAKVTHLTASERVARGKAAREDVPRASHSAFETSADRDPVAIVDADTPSRVPELVPIRYGRMLVSPFTFYRGAASLMAARSGCNAESRLEGAALRRRAPFQLRRLRLAARAISSSISTTSTRRCPARSSGTSSGWPQASRSQAGSRLRRAESGRQPS